MNKFFRSKKLLITGIIIIILNYLLPDPIPLIDELISLPVLAVFIYKLIMLLTGFTQYEKEKQKRIREDDIIEEGEIIE
jgi:hypothetical protein